MRKFAIDSNCYIDASRSEVAFAALQSFISDATPGLYVSSVVAAELRSGTRTTRERKALQARVLDPFIRRDREFTPSAAAWDAMGRTLVTLREREGLQLSHVTRSFALDILLAYSCREQGVVLITNNVRDMNRIELVFQFEHTAPYPTIS